MNGYVARTIALSCLMIAGACSDPPPDRTSVEAPRLLMDAAAPAGPDPLQVKTAMVLTCNAAESTSATVTWDASSSGAKRVLIYLRDKDAADTQFKLWTSGATRGSEKTPEWVNAGMIFQLREGEGGAVLASRTVACE